MQTGTDTEKANDTGARNWSDTSTRQGKPRVTSRHQKLAKRQGTFSLKASRRNQHLDFRLLSSRLVREYVVEAIHFLVLFVAALENE